MVEGRLPVTPPGVSAPRNDGRRIPGILDEAGRGIVMMGVAYRKR